MIEVKLSKSELSGELTSQVDILCSNCSESDTVHEMDLWDAAEIFINKGWVLFLNDDGMRELYCPKCIRKSKIKFK